MGRALLVVSLLVFVHGAAGAYAASGSLLGESDTAIVDAGAPLPASVASGAAQAVTASSGPGVVAVEEPLTPPAAPVAGAAETTIEQAADQVGTGAGAPSDDAVASAGQTIATEAQNLAAETVQPGADAAATAVETVGDGVAAAVAPAVQLADETADGVTGGLTPLLDDLDGALGAVVGHFGAPPGLVETLLLDAPAAASSAEGPGLLPALVALDAPETPPAGAPALELGAPVSALPAALPPAPGVPSPLLTGRADRAPAGTAVDPAGVAPPVRVDPDPAPLAQPEAFPGGAAPAPAPVPRPAILSPASVSAAALSLSVLALASALAAALAQSLGRRVRILPEFARPPAALSLLERPG